MSSTNRQVVEAFRDIVTDTMVGAKWQELDDAYHLDQNKDTLLRRGWGITIDGGSNTLRENCRDSIQRTLTVVITCEARAKTGDMDRQIDQELDLFDRLEELILAVRSDPTLTGTVYKVQYSSDSGRQEVFLENDPYYYVEAVFNVEYALTQS